MSRKFCNILIMWGTIRQLRMLLPRLWRWLTTPDCKMLTLPDTLWVILTGFASMAWSMALESVVLGLPDLAWSSRILRPEQNFNVLLRLHLSHNKCFLLLLQFYDPVQTHKTLHVYLCGFQITHGVKQYTACQYTNYRDTTNYSGYFPWLELLWSCDIHAPN